MSTIQEIMAELHAGEQAKARVPELMAMIDQLSDKLNASQKHAQELELRAKQRDEIIDEQRKRIAKLTEERDDASFRELEAQDRLATFEKAVGAAWGGLGNAINALHPPKPEPVNPAPTPVEVQSANPPQEASASAPTASPRASADTTGSASASGTSGEGQGTGGPFVQASSVSGPTPADTKGDASIQASPAASEGQSAPGPTAQPTPQPAGSSQTASSGNAESPGSAGSSTDWKPSVEPKPVIDEAGKALPSTAFEELKHRPFDPAKPDDIAF